MFIPSAIEALVAGREFPMTEGRQVRDFLYVDDCARALQMALDGDLAGTYNLASGVRSTMAETGRLAGEVTGGGDQLRPGALPYRPNELWEYFMDIGKLSEALGWRPEVNLKAGLERMAQYEKDKRR
jgi:GDP-4-dehydro-6-deoxy-D-mannose reductase